MINTAVLLEAALLMLGGIVGAALGTMIGLNVWSRRMTKRYDIRPSTARAVTTNTTHEENGDASSRQGKYLRAM